MTFDLSVVKLQPDETNTAKGFRCSLKNHEKLVRGLGASNIYQIYIHTRLVGGGFNPQPGYTKDCKNGTH